MFLKIHITLHIRVSQPNTFFLKINGSNPFPWYLGVGWKDPKRIFDLNKFWGVHKAVKNLTNIVKEVKMLWRRNCSGVMFQLILIAFQSWFKA